MTTYLVHRHRPKLLLQEREHSALDAENHKVEKGKYEERIDSLEEDLAQVPCNFKLLASPLQGTLEDIEISPSLEFILSKTVLWVFDQDHE